MVYPIAIRHNPEYFNFNCQATIPENWQADVLDLLQPKHGFYQVYGIGRTRQECIEDIKRQMRNCGLSGHLRIVSDDV